MVERILRKAALLAAGVLFLCTFVAAWAQEEAIVEYAWGTVKSVSADKLVVQEYDYEADTTSQATYIVGDTTEIDSVSSLAEVAPGDSVEVEFIKKDGQNIAQSVSIEKAPAGETPVDIQDEAAPREDSAVSVPEEE
jgi:hypothetical protein